MRTWVFAICLMELLQGQDPRPRARDLGVRPGRMTPGRWNAITDVPGVRVGHATLIRGKDVRTGVTAVLPHSGNLFEEKVPAAVAVLNGFGKLMGYTQIEELGEIETPILLTSTLSVPRVADALLDYMLALPGNERVKSINPVVAETNDGLLNHIRSRPIAREDVLEAIRNAREGPVEEGCVGAGTGTVAFGWKGGIGTSSRRVGSWTVGVLVQTNYGGDLMILGVPVGRMLRPAGETPNDGSVIVVIATDAPADARNLKRMAARAALGLGRTGAGGSNGSGDYAIAFSTVRKPAELLPNDAMSPLFEAVIEATEEAVYNSLFRATSMEGNGKRVDALPVQDVVRLLRARGAIPSE